MEDDVLKKNRYYEKIREIEVRGNNRRNFIRNSNEVVRELLENEPTQNYYQKKYMMEVVEPEKKRKDKILRKRKKMYRPIRKNDIVKDKKFNFF